ncbi:MAG: alpha/beta hydrolase [Planctomycetes bacterium]|nr:alpha/beta hydrolase [Planctomycetota bacterium]
MKLPENLESRFVDVDGWRLHYVASKHPAAGSPSIVMVHGLGLSHRYLVPMAERMADHVPVYLIDRPGFGKSHKPRRAQSLAESANWIARWIQTMDLAPACVMGQSFGTQVVVHLAVRHPDLVSRLVLQGMTVEPGARTVWRQFVRWRRNQNAEDKSASPSAFPDYVAAGPLRIYRTLKSALADRPEDLVPQIQCPTLVVRGENDPIGSQEWHEEIVRRLPHGRLVVMRDAAHTINVSAPDRLARLVIDFCAGKADEDIAAA